MAFYTGRETLIDYIVQDIPDGEHTFQTVANDELVNIEVEFYNFYDDVTYNEDPILGSSTLDARMLILKYHRNLTIGDNVLFTPQTRKRGMFVYVAKELVNYGIISMTARGAHATGQNLYICRDVDNELAVVPAVGAGGGANHHASGSKTLKGNKGSDGISRGTGGGGGGALISNNSSSQFTSGAGAPGTSYSGGSGGGGGMFDGTGTNYNASASSGAVNGGAGGSGRAQSNSVSFSAGGGAGNPGGAGYRGASGQSGTGGLLIIYCEKSFYNRHNGRVFSNGSNGGSGNGGSVDSYRSSGGGSGGGSINIFSFLEFKDYGVIEARGGAGGVASGGRSMADGGAGGDGSITISIVHVDIDRINILDDKYFIQTEVDLGNVIEGSYTEIKEFYLENMYNQDLTELTVWWEHKDEDNKNAALQISKTKNPFILGDELVYDQTIPYRSRVPFYMRLATEEGVEAGEFVLKTKVKSIPN